jgi:hypothetical protein
MTNREDDLEKLKTLLTSPALRGKLGLGLGVEYDPEEVVKKLDARSDFILAATRRHLEEIVEEARRRDRENMRAFRRGAREQIALRRTLGMDPSRAKEAVRKAFGPQRDKLLLKREQ